MIKQVIKQLTTPHILIFLLIFLCTATYLPTLFTMNNMNPYMLCTPESPQDFCCTPHQTPTKTTLLQNMSTFYNNTLARITHLDDIHEALNNNKDLEHLTSLLNRPGVRNKELINSVDKQGYTVLIRAIEKQRLDFLKELLCIQDVDRNKPHESSKLPPLHYALTIPGNPDEITKEVTGNPDEIIKKIKEIISIHNQLTQLLLTSGANSNIYYRYKNSHGSYLLQCPLHQAARLGNTYLADLLIKNGADSNSIDSLGNTPLHKAVAYGHKNLVILLTEHGADPTRTNLLGHTALHTAVKALIRNKSEEQEQQYKDILTLLVNYYQSHQLPLDPVDTAGNTPLQYAMHAHNPFIITTLITAQADLNKQDAYGKPPLYYAFQQKNSTLVTALVQEHKANPATVSSDNENALFWALDTIPDKEIITLLLSKGASPVQQNTRFNTPLHQAIKLNMKDMKDLFYCMLAYAPLHDIDIRDGKGNTLLLSAMKHNVFEFMLPLLLRGANPTIANNQGETPLSHILTSKHIDDSIKKNCIRILLEWSAQMDTLQRAAVIKLFTGIETSSPILDRLLSRIPTNSNPDNNALYTLLLKNRTSFQTIITTEIAKLTQSNNRCQAQLPILAELLKLAVGQGRLETTKFLLTPSVIQFIPAFALAQAFAHITLILQQSAQPAYSISRTTIQQLLRNTLSSLLADTSLPNENESTPLHRALRKNHDYQHIQQLLERNGHSLYINIPDNSGFTPLYGVITTLHTSYQHHITTIITLFRKYFTEQDSNDTNNLSWDDFENKLKEYASEEDKKNIENSYQRLDNIRRLMQLMLTYGTNIYTPHYQTHITIRQHILATKNPLLQEILNQYEHRNNPSPSSHTQNISTYDFFTNYLLTRLLQTDNLHTIETQLQLTSPPKPSFQEDYLSKRRDSDAPLLFVDFTTPEFTPVVSRVTTPNSTQHMPDNHQNTTTAVTTVQATQQSDYFIS